MTEIQQQKPVSARTLRMAAWAIIAYVVLSTIWVGCWAVYYLTNSWIIFAAGAVAIIIGALAEIYSYVVFRDWLRHNLSYDRCTRSLNALIIILAITAPFLPLMMLKGTLGLIVIGLTILLAVISGIPLLLISLALLKDGPDLWGLRKVFAVMGIISAVTLLTVIGFVIVGSTTFLVFVVLLIVFFFRAAKQQEIIARGQAALS